MHLMALLSGQEVQGCSSDFACGSCQHPRPCPISRDRGIKGPGPRGMHDRSFTCIYDYIHRYTPYSVMYIVT